MELWTAVALGITLSSRCGFRTSSCTSVGGRRADTPGSHGGSPGVTPTSARTLAVPTDSTRRRRCEGGCY